MTCTQIVTSIGLTLDVIGAILVAKDYWTAPITSQYETEDKGMLSTTSQTKRLQAQVRNYPYAKCGLLFLISGFIVQIIAQLI